VRLRRTGVPVQEVGHSVDLVGLGDAERAGRLELLRAHRRRVLARLDELHDDLAVIEWKIAVYQPERTAPSHRRHHQVGRGHTNQLPQLDILSAEPSTDQEEWQ
jgi:DNA-binding transcriptional MerR regulator